MKLETLYKRAKTGKIQFWQIEVTTNSIWPIIKKTSGQLGSAKPLVHNEDVKEGKNIGRSNETTPRQQAESMAKSDWGKKRDDGYKTLKDLGIEVSSNNVYSIRKVENQESSFFETTDISMALDRALPEFNTDASGNQKPQLAPTTGFTVGSKKNKYPALLEKKFDGNRTFCKMDSRDVDPYFLSRSGKPINTVPHLVEALKPLRDSLNVDMFPIILDGELYYHGLELEEINEAVKKVNENTPTLQFWVYDIPLNKDIQLIRSAQAASFVEWLSDPFIKNERPVEVNSDEEVIKLHDEWVLQGFEGAMKKDPKGTYCFGQRSSCWTKVKLFEDNEYEVIGGKINDVPVDIDSKVIYSPDDTRTIDSFVFTCKMKDGKIFDAKPGGSREKRFNFIGNLVKYIGKEYTVKHFGYTKYGIPNLPTGKAFRDHE